MSINARQLSMIADQRGIPLRTLKQVKDTLRLAKEQKSDATFARLMLKYGRLTAEARAYVAREYPN